MNLGGVQAAVLGAASARRRRLLCRAAALGSVVAFLTFRLVLAPGRYLDVQIYRAEGLALRGGLDLYGPLPGVHYLGTYPPFAVLLFVPAGLVSAHVFGVLSVLANVALLWFICRASVRLAAGATVATGAPPGDTERAALLFAVGLWCEPVFMTIGYGQVNLALAALVLFDLTVLPGTRWQGIGTGLAAAIKITPLLLIGYLVLTGRRRAGLVAATTFVASIAVSAAIRPGATVHFWGNALFDTGRVGRPEIVVNQSLHGLLVRALGGRDVSVAASAVIAVVLILGMIVSVAAYRRLGEAWGLSSAAVVALLVSPISWSHHWVWCVPIAASIGGRSRAWLVPTAAVFATYLLWLLPRDGELRLAGWQVVASATYVWFGLAYLGAAGWLSLARSQPTTATPGPSGTPGAPARVGWPRLSVQPRR